MECLRSHWRFPLLVCLALVLDIGSYTSASAEPLWKKLVPVRRVAADPSGDYGLSEENGPWLIVAATFSGEGAEEQAHDLVLELRRRYKLKAYLHEMDFDFSQGVQGKGVDRFGKPVRMRYQRSREIREIAVLVGDYESFDDPASQKTLERIKRLQPETLDLNKRRKTSQSLAALRAIQTALLPDGDARKQRGPMGKAFISRNPLLPREYFVQGGLDDLVLKMNRGVPDSLLDCSGKYTVVVATFRGTVILDQKKVELFSKGKRLPSRLAKAADKAHRLTTALRKKGYDAYEFHDRHESLVTIGSFNSVGTPRADGKIEMNPQIFTIMKTFGVTPLDNKSNAATSGFQPKTLAGIPFDVQPNVVQVPKRPAVRRASFRK
jgi:hypothetical protein